jgi:hypothetical protein
MDRARERRQHWKMLIGLEGAHASCASTFGDASTALARSVDRRELVRRILALFRCHDVNATRYLGHLFAVTFRAPYLRYFVLADGFGALERLAAFTTTILVGRHVHTPDQIVPIKSRLPNSTLTTFCGIAVGTNSIIRRTGKLSKRQVCRDISWLTQWWWIVMEITQVKVDNPSDSCVFREANWRLLWRQHTLLGLQTVQVSFPPGDAP